MSDWLGKLQQVLARAERPVACFFRDDDAGWSNDRLFKLLDLFEACAVPIDLAIIPQALQDELAMELLARKDRNARCLGLHQHGYAHTNHEQSGRKCEFGLHRSMEQQLLDLSRGKQRLVHYFGDRIDPIFTPPWNRCTATTVDCLHELEFRVLSRDQSATLIPTSKLSELPVTIDWARYFREDALSATTYLGEALAKQTSTSLPIGLMLHHAVMTDNEFDVLKALLIVLRREPTVSFASMGEIAGVDLSQLQRHAVHE